MTGERVRGAPTSPIDTLHQITWAYYAPTDPAVAQDGQCGSGTSAGQKGLLKQLSSPGVAAVTTDEAGAARKRQLDDPDHPHRGGEHGRWRLARPRDAGGRVGGELARAAISDLEVGYSARNGDEWDRLVGALDAFSVVETTSEHVRRALQVQRLLARDSQRGRKIPDLLIAAAAEDVDATVLHYDADFDRIAAVTGQPCRWVVPAGSVE